MAAVIIYDNYNQTVDRVFQWDSNRTVKITGLTIQTGASVFFHFSNRLMKNALVVPATASDIVFDSSSGEISMACYVADIPNELLMMPDTICLYVYESIGNAPERRTTDAIHIPVMPRQKPDDYVYSPTATTLVATDLKYEDGVLYLVSGDQVIGEGVPISGGNANAVSALLVADETIAGSAVEPAGTFEEVE